MRAHAPTASFDSGESLAHFPALFTPIPLIADAGAFDQKLDITRGYEIYRVNTRLSSFRISRCFHRRVFIRYFIEISTDTRIVHWIKYLCTKTSRTGKLRNGTRAEGEQGAKMSPAFQDPWD
jgi:hypothetical protein